MTFTPVPNCGYSSEEARMIALIILEQVGGGPALKLMTSASNFTSHNDEGRGALADCFRRVTGLEIRLPRFAR